MPRGNPYPHRYKFGKITKPIDVPVFLKLEERVLVVDRSGYSAEFIQALIALFYWTGLRKTEVLGRKPIEYRVKAGVRQGKSHPGLLKEDFQVQKDALYVYSVGEMVLKHGDRQAPLVISLKLPYAPLIKQQWEKTEPGHRVFNIPYIMFWRICKKIDPKFTPHFFRHNRITKFCGNPDLSLSEICAWSGLSPETVAGYMLQSVKLTEKAGQTMLDEH